MSNAHVECISADQDCFCSRSDAFFICVSIDEVVGDTHCKEAKQAVGARIFIVHSRVADSDACIVPGREAEP